MLDLNENSKLLLSIIQKNGPITKNKLLDLSKMTLSTLQRAIKLLIENKIVSESAIGESTGGRRPSLYDINPNGFYVIGVDMSRSYTRLVITNFNLSEVKKEIMLPVLPPLEMINLISESINKILKDLSIDKLSILGIGIGTIGPLDREKGVILNTRNLSTKEWINFPIRDSIEKELRVPTFIDNGANSAVLGEYLFRTDKEIKSIAYFNCGIGIRTGIVSCGNLIRTATDTEDSFGHMIIDMDGELCSCGNYGCVEAYSSILKITESFISKVKMGRKLNSSKLLEEISYIDICSMAEMGDELAKEVITNSATIFGLALSNYLNLLNPEMAILSGPLINHSNMFYEIAISVAGKKHYTKDRNKVAFSKGGKFKENSMALGSAAMVIEELLKQKEKMY